MARRNAAPKPTPQQLASTGPLSLKAFGSPEWCWQSVGYLKTLMGHVDSRWRQVNDVLSQLEQAKAWEKIPPEHPYGSFNALVKAETGISLKSVRSRTTKARLADAADQANKSRQGYRSDLGNNIPEVEGRPEGTSAAKALRRLRKDRPDLHAEVLNGRLSAHGAAVQAGFRPRTTTVPVDNPDRLAAALRRNIPADVLAEVIRILVLGSAE